MFEVVAFMAFKVAAVLVEAMFDFAGLIVQEVIAPLGYLTARMCLPLVSFGKVRVQPARSGLSWWRKPLRLAAGEPVEIHPGIATFVGASLWLAALAGLALLTLECAFP